MRILLFIIIAVVVCVLLYAAWRYIGQSKWRLFTPKVRFLGGPLHDQDFVVGPKKEKVLVLTPEIQSIENRYSVYNNVNGQYVYDGEKWESELDLDNSEVL